MVRRACFARRNGLEAPLEGTLLLSRNIDVPGVIGRIGTALGSLGVNIATFALGRRAPVQEVGGLALRSRWQM